MEPIRFLELCRRGEGSILAMQKRYFRAAIVFLMPLVAVSYVHAAEIAAGGLVLQNRLDITLERQNLTISPETVRIAYVFRSDSAVAQQTMIAFPMPPVPVAGGVDFLGGAEINDDDPANYMYFSAATAGRPITLRSSGFAYLGETDVSDVLRAAGLPLLISPDSASDVIAALPAEQFFVLEEREIVSRGGDDPPHFTPLWSYQTILDWQQTFSPGVTEIVIAYRPLLGENDDPGDSFETGPEAARYCVTDEIRSEIARRKVQGQSYKIKTIKVLLTIAQDWKGPIGDFSLHVETEDNANILAAFCLPGTKQIAPGQYAWAARDFTPDRDIAIAFFYFDPTQ